MNRYNAGMIQCGRGPRLVDDLASIESRKRFRVQEFERNPPVEIGVVRRPDFSHPAPADKGDYAVTSKLLTVNNPLFTPFAVSQA